MDKENLRLDFMHAAARMRKVNFGNLFEDFTQAEYFALEMIERHTRKAADSRGIYVNDLAKRLNMASSAVSRMLHTLECKELILREVDKNDRRNTYVRLTDEGRGARTAANQRLSEMFDQVIIRMGEADMRQLIALWIKMSDVMNDEIAQAQKRI